MDVCEYITCRSFDLGGEGFDEDLSLYLLPASDILWADLTMRSIYFRVSDLLSYLGERIDMITPIFERRVEPE
jgi:hypothetical protein